MSPDANDIEDIYPVSPMQHGMLYHSLLDPARGLYVQQVEATLEGPLDARAFAEAWRHVARRHAVLRTSFVWEGLDEPLQVVHRGVAPPVVERDLSGLSEDARAAAIEAFLAEDRTRGMDLGEAPLTRLALLRLSEREHHLVWTFHHILFDGWSGPTVLKEVFATYRALLEGRTPDLPPARPYSDYIAWLQKQDVAAAERYWRRALDGFEEPTPLPFAAPAQAEAPGSPREQELPLDEATTLKLQDLARRHRLTLSTLAQAAWGVVLSRYSGQDDVVFGVTVSGRPPELPGADGMVGLFINTLPLRLRVPAGAPVTAWLDELQKVQADFRQHEHTPLARIQAWSAVPRGRSLFDSILVYENYPSGVGGGSRDTGGLTLRGKGTRGKTNYPVTLTVVPHKGLSLRIAHDPARLDAEAARRMLGHLRTVLESIAADPATPVDRLRMLPPEEERFVLQAAEGPRRDYPQAPFPRVVAEWAARTPDATAVVHGDARVTYADLVRLAGRLASRLRAQGVQPGDVVGLCMERGVDAVVSVLATLMARAAYVPIDPALPPERVRMMLDDARARLVLTHAPHADRLPEGQATLLLGAPDAHEGHLHEDAAPGDAAYVIFTSGSTGQAKGAVVTHASLTNAMHAWRERYGLEPGGAHLQMAGFSFDVFTGDLARALGSGGTLVVCPRDHLLEPWNLHALLVREKVRYAEFVPSVLRNLHAHLRETGGTLPDMRVLVAGSDTWFVGEHEEMRARFGAGTRVINSFGVTEAAIDTTFFEGEPARRDADAIVPIGTPFPNMRAYVLDAHRRLMPVGVAGELYVGGAGVAKGYLNRPQLTAERFLDNPFVPGGRLYRTGDRARLLPDGNVEFLGRLDHQVKLRGHRVELGEIEAVLTRHEQVREAVVLLLGAGAEARLVAYVVPDGAAPTPDALREHAARHLPAHMVPAAFVALDAMPLTPNGKVDRRRLPAPEAPAAVPDAPAAPMTPTEEILAQGWAKALGVARVGPDDDFFALGGHSLVATQVISHARAAFQADVPLRLLFTAPTLRAFAREVHALRVGAPAADAPPIAHAPRDAPLPLSFAQERLWFLQEWAPESAAYNVLDPYRIAGPLDAAALAQAVDDVVARHEVLRTTLHRGPGGPTQAVHAPTTGILRVEDRSGLAPDARLDAARRAGADEVNAPFDLATGAFRARLLRFAPDDHALILVAHHAAYDGWSSGVLLRDLRTAYAARAKGEAPAWPAPPVQYADYAAWQRAHVAGERLARQLDHWRRALADAPVLDLPADKPRPPRPTYRGGRVFFSLGPALTRRLHETSRKEGATPFMTLAAAFHALLHRWTGQSDVLVGTPVHGRTRPELHDAVGCFVNTLPLRVRFDDAPTFAQTLARLRDAFLDGHANQDVPFERMVEAVMPARDPSRPPLCQAMVVQQVGLDAASAAQAWSVIPVQRSTAKFDLTLGVGETPDGVKGVLEFNADVLTEATASRMARAFESLLAAALEDPDAPVAALPIVDAADKRREVAEWNATDAPYPADDPLPALFRDVASRMPQAVAITGRGRVVTYGELDRASDALAAALHAHGVRRGDHVGLCAERDERMVAAMLAILKAGAAYVPLDPAYPPERLAWMVQDAGARVVVTGDGLAKLLPEGTQAVPIVAPPAAAPVVHGAATDPAYVIYTSGSTGTPKGIVVPHRAVARLVLGTDYVRLAPGDAVAQASNASFDAATFEVWGALLHGARLVLVDKETLLTPARLEETLRAEGVTTLFVTTALFNQTVRERPAAFSPLRELLFGGEAVDPNAVRALLAGSPPRRLLHVYGPTETTTFATWHHVRSVPEDAVTVPIGTPIANTRAVVLDARMQQVPVGVRGELYLGGPGVALGYHARPDLTAERFVTWNGERWYRTGDVVRRDANGDILFVGRADGQVKIRGFRIELGEVEAALLAEPDVAEAVAVVREDAPGRKELVAYVVPRGAVEPESLRARLRQRLPDHLVPAAVVALDAMPLNPNGKVDRKALPAPERRAADASRALTPDEERLAALWRDVLRVDAVGPEDDFFAVGGQSLLATQLATRIREAFQVDLPLRDVFASPRLEDMARAVANAPRVGAKPTIRRVQREGYRLPGGDAS